MCSPKVHEPLADLFLLQINIFADMQIKLEALMEQSKQNTSYNNKHKEEQNLLETWYYY
jgi:hypothetical protein